MSKNGKLSVRLYKDYPFEVYDLDGNVLTERGGTKKNFKISKKCKWLSADVAGNGALSGFYDRNSAKKSSYRRRIIRKQKIMIGHMAFISLSRMEN